MVGVAAPRRVYPVTVTEDARAAESQGLIEDALARMRENGGRATPARRLLLGALTASRGHRSVEELAADVQAHAPDVNLSTIYRNLDELERLKIVDRTHLGDGPATYHLAAGAHGHLVCRQCGTIVEVPDELFGDLASTARERYGFSIDPRRFAVIGLCSGCS
jgi:Fur family ferric uptake transcriptional regulator